MRHTNTGIQMRSNVIYAVFMSIWKDESLKCKAYLR
jgi:hypothetical protein